MTTRYAVVGHIAPSSQPAAMTVRGAVVEPTRTPIVARLTPLGAAIDCDCDEWPELMYTDPIEENPCIRCHRYNCNCAAQPFNVDPHGDLTWRDSVEIPF